MYFWYLWCCTITTIRNTKNQKIQPSSTQPYFLNPYYIRNLKSLTIIKCDFIKGLPCSTTTNFFYVDQEAARGLHRFDLGPTM